MLRDNELVSFKRDRPPWTPGKWLAASARVAAVLSDLISTNIVSLFYLSKRKKQCILHKQRKTSVIFQNFRKKES